jgi:hypothetical protein
MADENINQAIAVEPKKRLNLWLILSIISVLIILVLAFVFLKPVISGKTVINNDPGTKAVDFINNYLVSSGNVTFSSIQDLGNMYQVNVTYNGKIVPTYMTKDGRYFIQGIIDMDNIPAAQTQAAAQPANVTKSDKPKAQAFVFAYCPYGLQFEKALLPVYSLLKSKADISIVFIGAMHGEHEKVESTRQLCIQKEYGTDKLVEYLNKFAVNTTIGSCNGNDSCLSPLLKDLMSSISIDKSKIDSCMPTDGETLYNQDVAAAKAAGISGSPTFVINGVTVSVARSADAIKKAVCDAFTAIPSECSQTLSASAATAGFGSGTSASSSSAGCG